MFFLYLVVRSKISRTQKKRILFSNKKDWERGIKRGFRFTRHEVAFNDLSTCDLHHFDLIVPLTIRDANHLSEMRNRIEDNPIPIPDMDCIALCDDKIAFNQALINSEFRGLVPRVGGNLEYPYILKKRIDEWGSNSHIITDAQTEQLFSEKRVSPEYFSQELVPGHHEYATHILFIKNTVICSISNKYVFDTEMPVKGKDTVLYTRTCRCPFLDLFSSVLMYIGFNGLCCVNYKVRDNAPLILEINPRFGGSLSPYFFSFIRHIDWTVLPDV